MHIYQYSVAIWVDTSFNEDASGVQGQGQGHETLTV